MLRDVWCALTEKNVGECCQCWKTASDGNVYKSNKPCMSVALKVNKTEDRTPHDEVMKWRHFPRYWAFVREINSPVTGEFLTQRPVRRSFDVFFGLPLNKRLSKQSWDVRFETPSRPGWRNSNDKWDPVAQVLKSRDIRANPLISL